MDKKIFPSLHVCFSQRHDYIYHPVPLGFAGSFASQTNVVGSFMIFKDLLKILRDVSDTLFPLMCLTMLFLHV